MHAQAAGTLFLATILCCTAFVPSYFVVPSLQTCSIQRATDLPLRCSQRPLARRVSLRMSSEPDEQGGSVIDKLIEKMIAAPPYELPQIVGQNLKEVSNPGFFLRVAELSDKSEDASRKEALAALADNIVATLEVVSKRAEEQMDDAAEIVQGILAKAAEASGEFKMPLSDERKADLRAKIVEDREKIDEGVLSTIFAYMKKANEDGLDGLVLIFQKVLQLFAAEELLASQPSNDVLKRLLAADAEEWDAVLGAAMEGEEAETDEETMQGAVQACIETVVLQKASGSYGQRVQAEFLKELMARVRAVANPA